MVDMTPWRISKEEIMEIASRKGLFSVPRYLYRAELMARRCQMLVKDGKLKRVRNHPQADSRTVIYVPVNEKIDD